MKNDIRGEIEDNLTITLPTHDLESAAAERIRAKAHSILGPQRQKNARRSDLRSAYSRFLEPLLASGVAVFYLIWAIIEALRFYRILV